MAKVYQNGWLLRQLKVHVFVGERIKVLIGSSCLTLNISILWFSRMICEVRWTNVFDDGSPELTQGLESLIVVVGPKIIIIHQSDDDDLSAVDESDESLIMGRIPPMLSVSQSFSGVLGGWGSTLRRLNCPFLMISR
jgi:hypothetical protein